MDSNTWVAIGTVVNAVVVIVLAGINFRYLRIAARQAEASEQQARAAVESARVADETLKLLKIQIEDQSGLALTKAVDAFRGIKADIEVWIPRMFDYNKLPESFSVLPETWSDVSHWVRIHFPDLKQPLGVIQDKIEAAKPIIENVISTPSSGRLPKQGSMGTAAAHLREASSAVDVVLARLILSTHRSRTRQAE
jgi:hypothetical protein